MLAVQKVYICQVSLNNLRCCEIALLLLLFLLPVQAMAVLFSASSLSFYAPQLYRQVLLRRVLAMGILSICLSQPGGIPSPDEIETPGLHHMIAQSL